MEILAGCIELQQETQALEDDLHGVAGRLLFGPV
jgi:hypothetical protein